MAKAMDSSQWMLNDDERSRIIERYSERLKQYGVDYRTLNPGSKEKQQLQHSVHAEIGDLDGRTVLDIGCGLAHYYEYLLARQIRVKYIGYDIVSPFIEINRQRYPEARFEVRDISRDGISHSADYVTMCQVFNNKYEWVKNENVVQRALAVAFDAARLGVSIDMLSKYVNYEEQHLNYFSPEEMFAYAKSLTRFVTIRHDYLPFDFSLYLYKEATGK